MFERINTNSVTYNEDLYAIDNGVLLYNKTVAFIQINGTLKSIRVGTPEWVSSQLDKMGVSNITHIDNSYFAHLDNRKYFHLFNNTNEDYSYVLRNALSYLVHRYLRHLNLHLVTLDSMLNAVLNHRDSMPRGNELGANYIDMILHFCKKYGNIVSVQYVS
jgi:hypothetical protein